MRCRTVETAVLLTCEWGSIWGWNKTGRVLSPRELPSKFDSDRFDGWKEQAWGRRTDMTCLQYVFHLNIWKKAKKTGILDGIEENGPVFKCFYVVCKWINGNVQEGRGLICIRHFYRPASKNKRHGRQKNTRVRTGIEPLSTRTVNFVVLINKWGQSFSYKIKLRDPLTRRPSLCVQIGSFTKENKHADRWTDGHNETVMLSSFTSWQICENAR